MIYRLGKSQARFVIPDLGTMASRDIWNQFFVILGLIGFTWLLDG
jgi:hypothetical protein